MFLYQIEEKQRKMIEEMKKKDGPKMRVVPSSEIDPKKGLAASNYVDDVPERRPAKTMGLKLEADTHDRLAALKKKLGAKSKKEVVREALKIGMSVLEDQVSRE